MIIIALDPGGTTGVCVVELHDGSESIHQEELGGDHHKELWFMLQRRIHVADENQDNIVVVCESFEWRPHLRPDKKTERYVELVSKEYIGVTKLACDILLVEYVEQSPSVCKQFWSDKKLKAIDLYKFTPGGHINDATRHAMYYIMQELKDMRFVERLRL